MNSRNAHIVEMLDIVSHDFCGSDCLFCDWDIACPCGHYSDGSFSIFLIVLLQNDRAGEFSIFSLGYFFLYCFELFWSRSGGEDVASVLGKAIKNLADLRGSFAFSENYLRHPCAQRAVVVHFGKTEVLKWHVPQAVYRVVGRQCSSFYLLE